MSKYGDALDALDQESADKRVAVQTVASQFNPDQYATALERSKELDVPAQVIARNPDAYNKPSKYGAAIDAQDAPIAHEWASTLDNAAVAQDDLENLSAMEYLIKRRKALAESFESVGFGKPLDIARAVPAGAVTAVGSGFSGIGELNTSVGRTISRGFDFIGLDSVGEFLRKPIIPESVAPFVDPSRIVGDFGKGVKQIGSAIDVPEERQTLATDISGGLGQIGSQIAMMLLTGGTSSTAMLLGQGADIQAERTAAAGASEEQPDTAVIAGAGITALTEKYGLDKILNRVPPVVKSKVLRTIWDVAVAGGIEAAQEVTEGILQNLTEAAFYNPDAPLLEGLERDALAAGGTGAIARSIINTLLPGRQKQHAEANKQLAEEISAVAQESKLAQRSPEKLEELVIALKEQGGDSVYIEPEAFRTLFQSDEEAANFAGELTGDVNTYYEAAVSGSRIAIPVEKYVSRIATNKEALKILESVSFTPDGPTAKDVKESEEIQARSSEVTDTPVQEDNSQAIYDDVLGQLMQSGMERSTAERNATLMQSVFRTLAQRTAGNETPDAQALYKKYGLRIGRDGMSPPKTVDTTFDPLIDRLRAGDIPTEEQATADLEAGDVRAMDRRATLVQLGDYLQQKGVDLKAMDNEAVKELLRGEKQFDQSNDDGSISLDSLPSKSNSQSIVVEALKDGAGISAQELSDVIVGVAETAKSDRLIRVPALASMLPHMRSAILYKPQVLDAIVGSVPVDVVNDLFGSESAAKVALHNEAMLEDSLAFDADVSVAGALADTPKAVRLFVLQAAREAAKVARVSLSSGLKSAKGSSASKASKVDGLSQVSPLKDKRASITFGRDRQFTISLFEKADLTSFLHESGHFYLEVLADLAEEADAPQQVKHDFDAILKWFGVDSRDQIETEQHEQFARGFEAYLMEGKAPSVELQNLFARFRAWLVSVYRTLSKLNVELTPQVRSVMDRLVATDEEIEAAESQQNYAPIFSNAEEAGMSPEQWKAYKGIATRAHQAATENLTDQAMRVLKREQQAWFKEERAKVIDEVTTEVNAQPVYQALAFLQKATNADGSALPEGVEAQKLNKQALVDKYGKDFVKRLPHGITAKEGTSADLVGQMFGFASGDSLVEALVNARPKTQLVEMEADARMREKYGDLMTDGSITEEAMQSVHTDERAKVLAAELKALDKKRREVAKFVNAEKRTEERQNREAREANAASLPDADELKAIKLGVARIMDAKQVQAIQPNVYRIAEANAGRKAFNAAAKGDYDLAYAEKRRQILNHELYRAATKAREEVDGIVEYMRTFDKKATRERIAKAKGQYLEQIDALRERFDFSNVANIGQRDALVRWVAAQEAAGREVNVPEHLLDETKRVPYKMLTVGQLQGLNDAVKNIEHLAKTKDKLLKNKKAAEWQDAKAELLDRVETALPNGKEPPLGRFELSKRAKLAEGARGIADSLLRPETIVEWLDGGTTGPWHEYLWNQANDAEDMRESMRDHVAKPLFDLANKITRKRRNQLQEMVQIPSMGRALNRRTLISIALNMGNASNLDKLTRGGYRTAEGSTKFTETNLREIRDALTKEDWEFVQTVWDTVNQLWPDVVDFQKRMGGLVPEKVEAVPVTTKHGVFKGGYFPVVYDPTVSAQGEKQVAGDAVQEIMGQNFTRASTKKGHTKERTKAAKPLLLDFERVITRHMDQVITDLSHREFVLQAMKILDDGELRAQIQNRIGEGAFRSLQGMVRHTVRADGNFGDPAASGWMKLQDHLIRNTAVAALGFRAVTAFGNLVLAPVQGAARISPKSILKGIGEFYRSPREMTAFIHGQSEFMKHRAEHLDQALVETMANLRGERSIRAQVARAAMAVHRWADFLGTHALWIGKYRDVLDGGGSVEDAQREADKAIRQTQTAAAPKDLSAFERDPTYKAFRMFLGPMVIMGNRIREAVGRKGVVKNWPEAFGTLMAVWFVPALLWEIATGRGPDDDDEPKDMAAWALRKEFFYPFMTIPFVRDVANIVERKLTGQYAPSRSVPLAEAGELVFKAGQEAAKAGASAFEGEDVDGVGLTRDLLRASGPLMGMPSNQLDVTGMFLWDIYAGEFELEGVGDLKYLAIRR